MDWVTAQRDAGHPIQVAGIDQMAIPQYEQVLQELVVFNFFIFEYRVEKLLI